MSAASSAALPDPDPVLPTARPAAPARPALSVAGRTPPAVEDRDDPPSPPHDTARPAVVRPRRDPTRAPDDTRLRVWLVPRAEPPAAPGRAARPAHERPPVLGSPEATERSRPPVRDADPGAPSAPGGPLPDPTRLCCAVVQAAVEGLRGVRPLAQLTRWVTPEVYELLALRARLVQGAATAPSPARAGIRRVRVFRLGEAAAEATVVVDDGPRVRAVAVRVEEHRGRWRATALEIG